MRSLQETGKSVEGFTQWKQSHISQERRGSSRAAPSQNDSSVQKTVSERQMTYRQAPGASTSSSGRGRPIQQGLGNFRDVEGELQQKSTFSAKEVDGDGETSVDRNQGEYE